MKASSLLSLLVAIGTGALGGWYGREWVENGFGRVLQEDAHSAAAEAPEAGGAGIEPGTAEPSLEPVKRAGMELVGGALAVLSPEERAQAFQEEAHITIDLLLALEDRLIEVELNGNGRDQLKLAATNRAGKPMRLSLPQGQAFESVHGKVVLMRPVIVDLLPSETVLHELDTLALSARNLSGDEARFVPISHPQGALQPLLDHLALHPELSPPVAQTAALAILENLPASAFARFVQEGGLLPSELKTDFFKVETVELVQALILLRTLGYTDEALAITIDPQTKIEAMIDPLAHAFAMHYYAIEPGEEWAYWKGELLNGDIGTRHYALHGIARYYPQVALQMMPEWVREVRTSRIFRVAAAQALALIPLPEALEALQRLKEEFQQDADLAKVLGESIAFLEVSLRATIRGGDVAFRFSGETIEGVEPILSEVLGMEAAPSTLEIGAEVGE